MTEPVLEAMRDLIQEDVNRRGLRTVPEDNLISRCRDDFGQACASLAAHVQPVLAIVTGFFIPTGQPPSGETDGPLGAVFLARALLPLGIRSVIVTDEFCAKAIQAGLNMCGLRKELPVVVLPTAVDAGAMSMSEYYQYFQARTGPITHLLALERVGPSLTLEALRRQGAAATTIQEFLEIVPPEHQDRCHSLRGRDITGTMSPAHRLFENALGNPALVTIGIGDGGNEIGMGKIPWDTIRRNIPGGALVACRIPTQYLVVCGISNWGAYGLAAGVRHLRQAPVDTNLFDPKRELRILESMIDAGPLVDGVSGLAAPTVDGLPFDDYAVILDRLAGC